MHTGFWQAASGYLRDRLGRTLTAYRERRADRRELNGLLAKHNDHLIRDAGLDRNDLRNLADDWRG